MDPRPTSSSCPSEIPILFLPYSVKNSGCSAMWLEDISPDGRVLISNAGIRREMAGRAPGDDVDRNLSWFDWSSPQALSADGTTLLFDEQNIGGNNGYLVFVRGIDGSPPVQIGEGSGRALSPDGKWALSVKNPFGECAMGAAAHRDRRSA